MSKRRATDKVLLLPKRCKVELANISCTKHVQVKEIVLKVGAGDEAGITVRTDEDIFYVSTSEIETNSNRIVNISLRPRKYALRSRTKKLIQPIKLNETKIPTEVTRQRSKNVNLEIAKSERVINIDGTIFGIGEIVFAKTRGWCHWPAIILSITTIGAKSIVNVRYFRTNETADINANNKKEKLLVKFDKGAKIVKENGTKYNGMFTGALDEAKVLLKISKKKK